MLLRSLIFATAVFSLVEAVCAVQVHTHHVVPRDTVESLDVPITEIKSSPPHGMRKPPVGLSSEWITDSDSGLVTAKANTTLPLLFLGTPPPLIKVGFTFTGLSAAEDFDLPDDLYEYTIGLSWIRKINDRWTIRTMLGVGFATDNLNTSSDAWQFRGGVFGIYKCKENLSWTFGALATGRDDLPVIPAIGAVWMPNPTIRYDLTFPKPRINILLSDDGSRQQWAYVGGGINGSTWAYEQTGSIDDRLTYKDLRVVAGWESRPASNSMMPFALGKTIQAEVGYVFSREFEFEYETRVEPLDDSFMVSISTRF